MQNPFGIENKVKPALDLGNMTQGQVPSQSFGHNVGQVSGHNVGQGVGQGVEQGVEQGLGQVPRQVQGQVAGQVAGQGVGQVPGQIQRQVAGQGVSHSGQSVTQRVTQPSAGVSLKKGQKISLNKNNKSLSEIDVAIGWDLGPMGKGYDLDVEAFVLGKNGLVLGDDWFIFYNQMRSPDGAIVLSEDNRTGAGDGDDEVITIQLNQLNPSVEKVVFVVTINEALERGYNFSNVQNAYARIVDKSNNTEIARFNLTDYYKEVNSMVIGELYKYNNEFKFNAVGNGVSDGLAGIARMYGVNIV